MNGKELKITYDKSDSTPTAVYLKYHESKWSTAVIDFSRPLFYAPCDIEEGDEMTIDLTPGAENGLIRIVRNGQVIYERQTS